MATKSDPNMYEVYNVMNSHIFISICSLYSHSETSVHGHQIFKNQYYALNCAIPIV